MDTDFRQRNLKEYLQILWKRKWLMILPTVAIAVAVANVVYHLPNIYESSCLVTVRHPNVSTKVFPVTDSIDPSAQLNTINQQVKSRSSLESIIAKYNLYNDNGIKRPLDYLVERMRRDMRIEIENENNSTNAFRIFYRGTDAKIVQQVTSELASKYISAQIDSSHRIAESTLRALEKKSDEVKQEIHNIEEKKLKYMKSTDVMPSDNASLKSQLTNLQNQQHSLITDIDRNEDQRTETARQLNELKSGQQTEPEEEISSPKTSAAYAELRKRKAQLEAELDNMLTVFRPAHPEVRQKESELNSIIREINRIAEEEKRERKSSRSLNMTASRLRTNDLEARLRNLDGEIKRQKNSLVHIENNIKKTEQQIANLPTATVQYEELDREYNVKRKEFEEILGQLRTAQTISDITNSAQGTGLQVTDPATEPQDLGSRKRFLLISAAIAIGLLIGLCLVALFELPQLFKVNTIEDIEYYTGLPVIFTMPTILTPLEKRYIKRRRKLLTLIAATVTLASIPLLTTLLNLSHVFDRFSV